MRLYEAIKQEVFDSNLLAICKEVGVDVILSIPGIANILAEYFNNDVLTKWENSVPFEFRAVEDSPNYPLAEFLCHNFKIRIERDMIKNHVQFLLWDYDYMSSRGDNLVGGDSYKIEFTSEVLSIHTIMGVIKHITLDPPGPGRFHHEDDFMRWLPQRGNDLRKVLSILKENFD